ncbi:MAG TPA: tRNA (adenosine(37)-N6)-threonylcarbamoyltransferase complex ATPase subunit type 1 TsaE [Sphingomicrobium sp.]|jgi:tRNA threonylcarbamoyladenosine biosynthesis protein TsaE|nr:tRNA (adenosine(37)-N6)-threonylcarbamoyltransferase complex ATPase subunit type 1 TsaE [Sphingomicrobium sp.]
MILASEQATHEIGRMLAAKLLTGDVVTLSGPLGVGKTELVRALLVALGHEGEVPSPTFAIMQPYETVVPPVWHVDLYRLEDPGELEELGLDSLEDAVLLVEWPERAGKGQWPDALRLRLDFAEDGARRLTADVPPAWQDRWPPR